MYWAFIVIMTVATLSHVSNLMYIKVKDLVANGRYENMYELSYALYGRNAIYFVCFV